MRQLVTDIQADLWPHLAKEERVLFPAIKAVAEGRDASGGGSLANPIAVMTAEHESVGRLLHRLRAVTGGYEVPGDGCASYPLLYQGLEAVELQSKPPAQMHKHRYPPIRFAPEACLYGVFVT